MQGLYFLPVIFDAMKSFAIIGCGRIARRHAENILRVGRLAAVCDVELSMAASFANDFGGKAYDSVDEMLAAEKDVEMVAICSPNGFHAEHIIKSLQAGKDVLAEKPLCLTKAAAWQIVETEKYCRRKLFLVKSARYNPIIKKLKEAIDGGELGRIYSFHLNCIWNRKDEYYTGWKGKLFPDGGTLYNQFSHFIDVVLWLFGDVNEVKGFKANLAHAKSMEFEDSGAVALQMVNGAIGSFHWSVNAYQKNHEIALTIVAERGTVRVSGENLNEVQYINTQAAIELPTYHRDNWSNHKEIYDHLLSAQSTPQINFPDVFDGLRVVETIEEIYQATT